MKEKECELFCAFCLNKLEELTKTLIKSLEENKDNLTEENKKFLSAYYNISGTLGKLENSTMHYKEFLKVFKLTGDPYFGLKAVKGRDELYGTCSPEGRDGITEIANELREKGDLFFYYIPLLFNSALGKYFEDKKEEALELFKIITNEEILNNPINRNKNNELKQDFLEYYIQADKDFESWIEEGLNTTNTQLDSTNTQLSSANAEFDLQNPVQELKPSLA